jgi:hypothetical protein
MTFSVDDRNRPIRFAGETWIAAGIQYVYSRGATSANLTLHHLPRRSTPMTEAWTGRKYRGKLTDGVYEILGEPIDANGTKWVAHIFNGSGHPMMCQVSELEGDDFTRIREPKFTVGDKVACGYDTETIEAVSRVPDKDGDFGYITRDEDGHFDLIWDHSGYKKVSE